MSEDDFHEIQLNGKQLVFLFMSATVVAVVIFLMGVMVGRGVRAPRPAEAVEASASGDQSADPTATAEPAPLAVTNDGTPAAAGENLTYPERLEDPTPAPETLKDSEATPSKAAAPTPAPEKAPEPAPKIAARTPEPTPKAAPAPASPAAKPATPPPPTPTPGARTPAVAAAAATAPIASEPKGNGYVVQVAATRDRSEADTIARRLAAKGYPTFVASGGARMFRVRVGKYSDRREAENVAHKLQQEEQFKPWITR